MHLVGASLCVLLHRCEQAPFDLGTALGQAAGSVLLSEKPLLAFRIDDLHSLVTSFQVQFVSLYVIEHGCYGAEIDVELVCVQLLRHLGSLLETFEACACASIWWEACRCRLGAGRGEEGGRKGEGGREGRTRAIERDKNDAPPPRDHRSRVPLR